MGGKPLYKRLKYGNILLAVVVVLFAVLMLKTILGAGGGDDPSSVIPGESRADNSSSEDLDSIVSGGVLGKITYTYVKIDASAVSSGSLVNVSSSQTYKGGVPGDCVSCYDYMYDYERNKLFSIKSSEVTAKASALEAVNRLMSDYASLNGQAAMVLSSGYSGSDATDEAATGSLVEFKFMNSDGSVSAFNPIGSYKYLADNAYRYGLILRYPEDKSSVTGVSGRAGVFRYVGQPHAQIMYKNDLCLEEYLDLIKGYSYDSAIAYTTEGGKNYAVYYAASTGEATNVKIPTDESGEQYKYEISGDNSGGFIITVELPD